MGIMNMFWHENIILWNNSTVNREKKQKQDQKPLNYTTCLESAYTTPV